MLINVRNGKDLITIDIRCKQIRYCKDIANHGEILFSNLSTSDVEGFTWLFMNNRQVFLASLKEDVAQLHFGIDLNIKNLVVEE